MLSPSRSIDLRISNSYSYIQHQIKFKANILSFTSESSRYTEFNIMNSRVAEFLQKKSFQKHQIIELNLNSCYIDDKCFGLISKGNWKSLEKLLLFKNLLTEKGFVHLSQGNWKKLREIDFSKNMLTGKSGKELKHCALSQLTHFSLASNSLTATFFVEIKSNNWKRLVYLDLKQARIMNMGLNALVKIQWSSLDYIDLQSNILTDCGLKVISKGQWPKLKTIELSYNYISSTGIRIMAKCNWPCLVRIGLRHKPPKGAVIGQRYLKMQKIVNIGKAKQFAKYQKREFQATFTNFFYSQDHLHKVLRMLSQRNIDFDL